MPLILGTNSIKDTGYNVANSLRFDDATSDYLSFAPSSASNRRTWTLSFWTKRANLGQSGLFGGWDGGSYQSGFASMIYFNNSDQLEFDNDIAGVDFTFNTDMKFRDVSAWYHIVIAIDTTQSTETNRQKIYVNGSQVDLTETALGFPTQNFDTYFNKDLTVIGSYAFEGGAGAVDEYSGYMAEVVMIDGQQLDATSFGEFDSDTNIWKPIDVSGLTFGTNGFYLDFENSGSLGADVSGNGNNFTVNNLTSIDQTTDTCTNNFATMNPLVKTSATFSEGNLKHTSGAGDSTVATFGVSSGKWYFESKILGGSNEAHLGYAFDGAGIFSDNVTGGTVRGSGYVSLYTFDGKIYNEGSATASFGTFSANDIIGFLVDVDAGDVFLYQNGTALNSGSAVVSGKTGKTWFPFGNFTSGSTTGIEHNFGNPIFSISSGNSDPAGYGNFEYSTNNGYSFNTKNLAEYG